MQLTLSAEEDIPVKQDSWKEIIFFFSINALHFGLDPNNQ